MTKTTLLRFAPCVTLTVACGRIAFDPRSDAVDPGCWPAWHAAAPALSPPEPVAAVNTGVDESNPSLSTDGLALYFQRGTGTASDVWVATRPDRSAPFGTPTPVVGLDDPTARESRIALAGRAGVLVAAEDPATPNFDLYAMSVDVDRATARDPSPFAAINTAADEVDADLTGDGLRVYYTSVVTPDLILVTSTRTALDQPFGPSQPVSGLIASNRLADPTASPDDTVLVYSDYASPTRIHVATRTSPDDPFVPGAVLLALTAGGFAANVDLSNDGCELVFSSTRMTGDYDIWTSRIE